MPAETVQAVNISCDNPNCPGHSDLNKNDRTGWLFVSAEVYGDPTQQFVYGSKECLNAHSGTPEFLKKPDEPAA